MRSRTASLLVAIAGLAVAVPAAAQDPAGMDLRFAAFAEACLPPELPRPSVAAILAHAEALGWARVEATSHPELGALVAPTAGGEGQPTTVHAFEREVEGRPLHLLVTLVTTDFGAIAGCYLYDFEATARIADTGAVTRLGNQPLGEFNPDGSVNQLWMLPPGAPGVFEVLVSYVPEGLPDALYAGVGMMARWSPAVETVPAP